MCHLVAGRDVAAAPLAIQVNATTPGTLTTYSTMLSAGFEWRILGDDDGDCTATLEYRKTGDINWLTAQTLLRVERDIWTHGESPGNLLAGSLFFLSPGTAYQARLTLSDPDGGSAQQVVAFATRRPPRPSTLRTLYVAPGAGGGTGTQQDPYLGLATADAAAQPGDLFILQPGTYAGPFVVTHDGDATQPITYRGADPALVTIDGGGGATSGSHCISLQGRRYVTLEDMRLVNALRPVNADSTLGVTIRGCYIEPIPVLSGAQGIRAAFSTDLFISNNTVVMPGEWEAIGRTGAYGTGGYAILFEGSGHIVCFNTIIETWDAISIPVTGTALPAWTTSNVDVYGNFVDRASDDGIQADAIQHNVRLFRNRLLNTGSAMSFQPAFGGPAYMLFNEVYNTRIEPYKFHQETFYGWTQETSGFIAYHNTTVCNRQAWYESGIWRHGRFRNNLFFGGRVNTYTLRLAESYAGADFDYDGFNRVSGSPDLVNFSGAVYPDLAAWFSATGNEGNGVELGTSALADLTLPHHPEWNYSDGYGVPYAPGDNDLQLAPGSAAMDEGLALANINDGFSGSAPDLGCYEWGSAVPRYGPRSPGAELTAMASATVTTGPAPLTVAFNGSALNTTGIVTAYHWDFGDGVGAAAEKDPEHTYTYPGVHEVTLEVIDADGAIATTGLQIQVTGSTAGVDAGEFTLALGPAFPNPFTDAVSLSFVLPRAGAAHLAICDLSGRIVRHLEGGPLSAGVHRARWDGRDDRGHRCAAGLYFARLEVSGQTRTVKVVLGR